MIPNNYQSWSYTHLPYVIKDLDTIIRTNPLALKHDKIQIQYSLQIEVNLNQPLHTHNTQTIIVIINISISQHKFP